MRRRRMNYRCKQALEDLCGFNTLLQLLVKAFPLETNVETEGNQSVGEPRLLSALK